MEGGALLPAGQETPRHFLEDAGWNILLVQSMNTAFTIIGLSGLKIVSMRPLNRTLLGKDHLLKWGVLHEGL